MSDVITLHVDEPQPITLDYIEAKIKPETVGHATPTEQAQTVTPAPGTTFSAVEVDAIPPEYVVPSGTIGITENGETDVREFESALVAVPQPSGKITITENGSGLDIADYAEADVSVQPNLQTPDPVTPTKQQQTITPSVGYDGLAQAVVEPIPSEYIVPSGKITLTENATDVDIKQYAAADIVVGGDPEKGFILDDWDDDGYPTRARFTGTWTSIPNNFLGTYVSSTQITFSALKNINDLTIPDTVTSLGSNFLSNNGFIKTLTLGKGLTDLSAYYLIRQNGTLETIVFKGDITKINGFQTFRVKKAIFEGDLANLNNIIGGIIGGNAAVELYDFSHTTSVFPLPNVSFLPHANGCVVRVPSELLSDWQNETNWNALTDIVWEGV